MKRLSILGSTGSIGVNTLHIVSKFPERFKYVSLFCLQHQLLKQQILQFP
jgi:1-deoxy-D-xylulose 5-phosphate reductoisomerase